MHRNSIALWSTVVASVVFALASGCALDVPDVTADDEDTVTDELRRHCESSPENEGEERCKPWKKSRRRSTKSDGGVPMPEPDAGTPRPGETDAGMPPVEADAGVTPPPPSSVTCTSFGYSAWGACQANGMQSRTVRSSAPNGCVGGTPVVSQACQYTPPLDGTALYAQYCANCHGNSQKGASASSTKNAINANRGNMGKLSGLTAAQLDAIAQAP